MNDRFRFRAIDNRDWSNEKGKIYYDAQDAYDWGGGEPDVPATCFGSIVDCEGWIVEQCTGLKDKNGRLIYEHDIVKITGDIMTIDPRYDNKLYVVNYSDLSFGFDMVGEEKGTLYSECWDYEVVGNIHENPELLEDK